jgi:hypothetical protein
MQQNLGERKAKPPFPHQVWFHLFRLFTRQLQTNYSQNPMTLLMSTDSIGF